MAESQIGATHGHAALIRHNLYTEGSPDGMLKAFLQQQKIGRSKPVVLVTGAREIVVDVLSAERLLKVERYKAGRRGHRFRQQQSHSKGPIQISRTRNLGTVLP